MPTTNKNDLSSNISNLSINSGKSSAKPAPSKKKTKEVADSWEDEDVSDSDPDQRAGDDEDEDDSGRETPKNSVPAPPPPTPMRASYSHGGDWDSRTSPTPGSPRGGDDGGQARRPEKTDAVARRLIAAGLGLKAPRQTEEQKAYQKSVREQERKRRDQTKQEEQAKRDEMAKAKAAVWDD